VETAGTGPLPYFRHQVQQDERRTKQKKKKTLPNPSRKREGLKKKWEGLLARPKREGAAAPSCDRPSSGR